MTDSQGTEIHNGDTIASQRINSGEPSQPVKYAGDMLTFQCGKGEFYLNQASLTGDGWVVCENTNKEKQ